MTPHWKRFPAIVEWSPFNDEMAGAGRQGDPGEPDPTGIATGSTAGAIGVVGDCGWRLATAAGGPATRDWRLRLRLGGPVTVG
jgi:hypothetical protein